VRGVPPPGATRPTASRDTAGRPPFSTFRAPGDCIFLDGIYTRGADDRLSFRRVVPLTEDIERLVVRITTTPTTPKP